MTNYDVEAVADELMLTTEELKEIFGIYFEDTAILVAACQTAMGRADYNGVSKAMHALKGASLNLRMHNMGKLAADLESLAKREAETELPPYLLGIQDEINAIKANITAFYAAKHKI